MPQPVDDQAWDGWFWYWTGTLSAMSLDDDVSGQAPAGGARVVVDSKAMRKFTETDVIVGVIQVVESGAAVMRATLETRTLLKLP